MYIDSLSTDESPPTATTLTSDDAMLMKMIKGNVVDQCCTTGCSCIFIFFGYRAHDACAFGLLSNDNDHCHYAIAIGLFSVWMSVQLDTAIAVKLLILKLIICYPVMVPSYARPS
jgi:hypothetical protein